MLFSPGLVGRRAFVEGAMGVIPYLFITVVKKENRNLLHIGLEVPLCKKFLSHLNEIWEVSHSVQRPHLEK